MKRIFGNKKDVLGFDDRQLVITGIPVIALLINLLFFGYLIETESYYQFLSCFAISVFYTTSYWLSYRELYYFIIKSYPNIEDVRKRVIITILSASITFILLFYILHILQMLIFDIIHPIKKIHIFVEIIASGTMTALVLSIYEAIYSQTLLKKTFLEKESLHKSKIEAELMGLRSQINPHFLFNSLNTLTNLIHIDQDRAESFSTKLSKAYRYMLENKEKSVVPLREELDWAASYVHLLKERFGENMSVNFLIDDAFRNKLVLPLCLQILFENVIKHNIITAQQPLKIEVSAIGNKLCVKNTLQPKSSIELSTKVGIANLKQRYAYYTEESIEIHTDHGEYKICLPFININSSTQ